MSKSDRNKRRKRRSDRHKKTEVTSNDRRRSTKHTAKQDFEKTKKYKRTKDRPLRRTRSERHHENNHSNKKGFTTNAKRMILTLGIIFVLALISYTTILYGGNLLIDEEKLVISPPTTIETEAGDVVWYLYDEYRVPVALDEIPDHVKDAFVAIEDKRFYTHSGVDFRSVVRAIYQDIIARSKVQGGSTLTQQLAKNLFLTNDKSWLRKLKEAMIALYLEREFTKDEILEMYLNVVYFGKGQYGIEAAANKYFNKSVGELTVEEGALFAGMVKAPNGYSPIDHEEKARNRRDLVLDTMGREGLIKEEDVSGAQAKQIKLEVTNRPYHQAYHSFVDLVIHEAEERYGITLEQLRSSRYRIITSLHEDAQQIAFDEFQQDSHFPGNNMKDVEGAFVMMDVETGRIAAAIGGRHYEAMDLNRVGQPIGQPGSTMKPIAVYAPALESEKFHPFSTLPDELEEWDGNPIRNYNNEYEGEVTFYNALKNSKNTSAAWLLDEIGIDYAKSYLDKMKINLEDEGVRIALGGIKKGLSPIQLMQSYRTFIHEGEMIDAHAIKEIHDYKGETVAAAQPEVVDVFSKQVAWHMTEMLKEVVVSGTGQSGYYPHELAGKTGSTQHPKQEGKTKDAWFVGYTPQYVTALWMGYDDISQDDHYLTGGSAYPTQLTKKILTEMDKRQPLVTAFTKPENVQALAEPIELPVIKDLSSSHVFGGLKLLKGKLSWTGPADDRIVYRVYEENGDEKDKKIGEVNGDLEFVVDKFSLFDASSYYVIPYDPLAEMEGEPSNTVQLTF